MHADGYFTDYTQQSWQLYEVARRVAIRQMSGQVKVETFHHDPSFQIGISDRVDDRQRVRGCSRRADAGRVATAIRSHRRMAR